MWANSRKIFVLKRSHVYSATSSLPEARCDYTSRGNTVPSTIDTHSLTHSLAHSLSLFTFRPFECMHPDCGRSFGSQVDLTRHIRQDHSGAALVSCSYDGCSRSFKTQWLLNQHIRERHSGNKTRGPYICRFQKYGCQQVCNDWSNRKKHEGRCKFRPSLPEAVPIELMDEFEGEN